MPWSMAHRKRWDLNRSLVESLAFAVIPVIVDAVTKIWNPTPSSTVTGVVATTSLLLICMRLLWVADKPNPLSGAVFTGLAPLTDESALPQSDHLQKVVDRLRDNKSSAVLVLVGPSGAGKSTLVSKSLVPWLATKATPQWKCEFIRQYDSLMHLTSTLGRQLDKLLGIDHKLLADPHFDSSQVRLRQDACPSGKLLIIFDQAEQMLYLPQSVLQWLVTILENLKEVPGIRILLILREDFYLKMRFLGPLLPKPQFLLEVPGLEPAIEDVVMVKLQKLNVLPNTARTILDSLRSERLTPNSGERDGSIVVESRGVILPLEVEVIGLMIENMAAKLPYIDDSIYLTRLNGKDGLTHAYFMAFMRAAPDSNVAIDLLCVLSTGTRLRTAARIQEIARICYYSEEEILENLQFLEAHNLVVSASGDRGRQYQWAHDWLAARFGEFSTTEMDVRRRDNIVFIADRIQRGAEFKSRVWPVKDCRRNLVLLNVVFTACITVIGIRLLMACLGNMVTTRLSGNGIVAEILRVISDPVYVPFAMPHATWAIFVRAFGMLFVRLKSAALTVICFMGLASVVATVIVPKSWLITIGLEAFVIACVFWYYAWEPRVLPEARRRLSEFASKCFGGTVLCSVIGVWFYYFWTPQIPYASYMAWGLSAAFALAAINGIQRYGSRDAIAIWLGIFERRF